MSFEPVQGQYYRLVAKHSGKVVEVHHNKAERGMPIQQGDWVDGEYQQFQFHKNGRYYNIVARFSGKSFDVPGESSADGLGIIQWDRHDYSHNQQFELLPAGGGNYYIGARQSQKFLCMKEGGKGYGVPLVQQIWNGGDHFQFSLVPCGPNIQPRALREAALRGLDPIRDSVLSLLNLIPTAGGGVKFLVGLFWPETDGSLVDQIRDYVRNIARQMIDEEYLSNLAKDMEGIRNVIRQYAQATPGGDKGQWMTSMLQKLEASQPYYFDQRAPEKTLPHLLTLGSMHLSALRERYDNFEQLYGKKPDKPAVLLKDLQVRVKLYVDGAKTARDKTLEWRLKYIELSKQMTYVNGQAHHDVFVVEDRYDGFRHVADTGHLESSRAEGNAVYEERKRQVTESFNAELDALFGPALVWKYINPELKDPPKVVRVTSKSGLFGAKKGTEFSGEKLAAANIPISEIGINLNAAGDRVLGLHINRGSGGMSTWGAYAAQGNKRTHTLAKGEVIAAAYGTHGGPGDPLYSLYFVTNKGHIVGGGRRDIGKPWGSEPPTGAETQFETVFGWASAERVEGLGFSWSYARKE
jgi:Ricin-type beta-trefoil lectin domain-like